MLYLQRVTVRSDAVVRNRRLEWQMPIAILTRYVHRSSRNKTTELEYGHVVLP